MDRPTNCNKCGQEFTLDEHRFGSIRDGDFVVQYFSCPACGAKYHILATNSTMRSLIERRKAVQMKIKAARAKRFKERTFKKYLREYQTEVECKCGHRIDLTARWPCIASPAHTASTKAGARPTARTRKSRSSASAMRWSPFAGTETPKSTRTERNGVMAKKYIDSRGWKYQVMSGLGENSFKARYQRPEKQGDAGWKGVAAVPWRGSREEAQTDLDQMAEKKGWAEWNG